MGSFSMVEGTPPTEDLYSTVRDAVDTEVREAVAAWYDRQATEGLGVKVWVQFRYEVRSPAGCATFGMGEYRPDGTDRPDNTDV